MHPNDRKKIEQTITMLQQVLGQKSSSGSGAVQKITIPGFDQQLSNAIGISQQLQPEIKELNNILTQAFTQMQNMLNYSAVCKMPTQPQKKALQQKFMSLTKRIDNVEKNQNYMFHARAVRQLISVPFWVFSNNPQIIIKGGIQSADFHAIKFQKNKNQGHNDWWKSLGRCVRILQDFAKKQYAMGLNYNSNGSQSWSNLISGGSSVAQQSQQQTHQNAPQQNIQTAPVQQAQPKAPKQPKKQMQGLNWLVANFTNQKITFNPQQVQMKHGIFIQNCKDCSININDKFKSLQMNNCSNIILIVNTCVSGVEVMNGQNLQVRILGQTPSISIDKCKRVRVILNQAFMNTDIVTSKVSQINITYEKNGNQAKSYMVAEQLITKWNADKKKFQTSIYDKFL